MRKQISHTTRLIIKRFRNSFSFRTGIVLSGSVVGQAISFALLPAIARLYGAETIGQAGVTIATLGILSLLIAWQYDQALIVAESEDLDYLLMLAILFVVALSTLLFLGLYVASEAFPGSLPLLRKLGIDYYLVLLLLPYSLFLILVNLQLRNNQLLRVGSARLIYYGGTAILQVVAALLWGATRQVFLLTQALAAVAAILPLISIAGLAGWQRRIAKHSIADIGGHVLRVAREYADFPRYQAPAQVLLALSLSLPVLVLNSGFSATWAGWYFMANRLLAAPTVLLSQAIGQVFYRDSAERERSGVDQVRILERTVSGLMEIGLFFGVALGTTAPFWVRLILGEDWAPMALILQILMLVYIVTFFTSPITPLLNVKGKQRAALGYYSMLAFVRALAVYIAWVQGSEWLLVWAYASVSLVVMLLLFRYIIRAAGGNIYRILQNITGFVMELAIVIAAAAALSVFGLQDSWQGTILLTFLLLGIALKKGRQIITLHGFPTSQRTR